MKKVLMVAYYYPPLGGVGAVRPLQFSKYLPEYGWEATVLSVRNDTRYLQDRSMMKLIPSYQQVIRAYRLPFFETIRRLARGPLRRHPLLYSFVDAQYDWVSSAIRTGSKLISSGEFQAVLATAPPYSALRVARALKNRYGIPTVADLRDPYTTNEMMVWPTKWHREFYSIYERKLLGDFDYLISANESNIDDISSILGLSRQPLELITNGYDPEDFAHDFKQPSKDRFMIGYVGSIYGKVTPRPFFESLRVALSEKPEMREHLDVVFMGKMQNDFVLSEAKRANVEDVVTIRGYVPHSVAISFLHECHLLVLFGGMVSRSIPAKTFEYAASKRPILGFDHPDVFGDFITRNRLGFSVNGLAPKEGAAMILELYDMFDQGTPFPSPLPEDTERFSRKHLTAELARILNSVIKL
jgi:glycosyltransferase involved in cell wall biosynthesis